MPFSVNSFHPQESQWARPRSKKPRNWFTDRFHGPDIRPFGGFTLTELIVVLALVAISSTVVIFNYRGSRQSGLLTSAAYDVASVFRTAALGGRTASQKPDYSTVGASVDNAAIGVYINSDTISSRIRSLKLYREFNGVPGYQIGDVDIQEVQIDLPQMQARLCGAAVDYANPSQCTAYTAPTWVQFSRLSTEPRIEQNYDNLLGANAMPTIQLSLAVAGNTQYRHIVIERTGNIFIK